MSNRNRASHPHIDTSAVFLPQRAIDFGYRIIRGFAAAESVFELAILIQGCAKIYGKVCVDVGFKVQVTVLNV